MYQPYGGVRYTEGTLPTDFTFTGQRAHPDLGLMYYRARYYDPLLGRFISADPLVPEPGNPQSLNRYAYVYNNPLRYTDPSGHWVETAVDIVSLGMTLNDIRREGFTFWNTVSLATDIASLVLPGVPAGASHIIRAARWANNAANAAQVAAEAAAHADEAVDALRAAEHLPNVAISLERFRSVGRESIPQILEAFGDAVRPMGDIPPAFQGRRVTTLGRTWDIEAAKELGGFRVLDDPNWSIERNYEWLMEAIENGDVFYLASPVTEATLKVEDPLMKYGGISVFMRELDLLLQSGYRRVGDYLIPPR